MSTTLAPVAPAKPSTPDFEVVAEGAFRFTIRRADGTFLTDKYGRPRWFSTANSARKRISRERAGNFHK